MAKMCIRDRFENDPARDGVDRLLLRDVMGHLQRIDGDVRDLIGRDGRVGRVDVKPGRDTARYVDGDGLSPALRCV